MFKICSRCCIFIDIIKFFINKIIKYSYKIINNPLADPELKLKSILYLGDLAYTDDSRRSLELLWKSNPKNFDYLWASAVYKLYENDLVGAINIRLQIAKIDPFNHLNYLELLKIYNSLGKNEDAIRMKIKIENIDPNSNSAKIARTVIVQQ